MNEFTPLQSLMLENELTELKKYVMELYSVYHKNIIINEGIDDFIRDTSDIQYQFDEAKKRYQAALKGLALSNKLRDPEQRRENKRRVMGNMNRLRAIVKRLDKEIEQIINRELPDDASATDRFDQGRMQARRGMETGRYGFPNDTVPR